MTQQCIKARVTGKVQGVFFRRNTQMEAKRLGIVGYAKNLSDGSVEVLACGEPRALEQLTEFLHQGPEKSRVDSVDVESAGQHPTNGFDVL
ncbi:acylphosphatase [Lacimicrobium sp. SS2-24]|uniref:acylphosphatase n=1 Tax=Lacimicrobium sp. SS2-24 TaxID=2005569 RepID=UPI000B4C086E|nr:acylphosphatase [Lacimicrobium sp. SS2-24]